MAKHVQHLEELLFNEGTQAIYNLLKDSTLDTTLKWDGIGIIAGVDDYSNFVATKSYFNKTPRKFYYSDEIDAQVADSNLAAKLKWVLEYHPQEYDMLEKINQGDILWYPGSFGDSPNQRIFRPNIIQYRVPLNMIQSDQDIGITWHSDLVGSKFGNGLYKSTNRIWSNNIHVRLPDVWYEVNHNFDKLLTPTVSEIFNAYVKDHYNKQEIFIGAKFNSLFKQWYYEYVQKQVDSYKTTAKKNEITAKFAEVSLSDSDLLTINKELQLLISIKNYLLETFEDQVEFIETFIEVDGKEQSCRHEGFVMNSDNSCAKIVARYDFSRLNRADNVTRGWTPK